MRGKLLTSVALSFGFVVGIGASTALADVTIDADVYKDKDTTILETIIRDKDVKLDVTVMSIAEKFSEALAILNQSGENGVGESSTSRTDRISGSGSDNSGITVINQSSGSLNNQGSSISGTAVAAGDVGEVFSEAQAAAGQYNATSNVTTNEISDRSASIDNALNTNSGVLHANQSVGNMNNQGNGLSLALSFGAGGVVLTDSALGQSNSGHVVNESSVTRTASMTAAVMGNSGVVGVNQAAGNFANQANLVAIGMAVIQ